ncbi:MAG: hypothetical protein WBW58_19120, partial [Candidatus Acidiferrum sp.]
MPPNVLFGALRHPALRLRKAIPLRTEWSTHGVSVIWDEVEEFGFGETFSAAIDDFAHIVAELYIDLLERENLSSDLVAVRDQLSHYL